MVFTEQAIEVLLHLLTEDEHSKGRLQEGESVGSSGQEGAKKVRGQNLVPFAQQLHLQEGREGRTALSAGPGIQPEAACGLGRGARSVSTLQQRTLQRGTPRVLALTGRVMRPGGRQGQR